MDWIKTANLEEESLGKVQSFAEYMDGFKKNPRRQCRQSHQYFIDMFCYHGKDEKGDFKLFSSAHPDASAVFGQRKAQESFYENLINFQDEGKNNKFILLVGPNGSSKSSLIRKIMQGAEEYSKTGEGELYTFSWVFPVDSYIKGTLGLGGNTNKATLDTYAKLDDKDIRGILSSELKDHPLLLIPKKYRQKIIEEALESAPDVLGNVKKSYLYQGDLSKRNRMVYDALLKNYKEDHEEVLKHVRVERLIISRRYSVGAATIEPQMHVDVQMQQITMDRRLASLPPSLQSLNLFSLRGEVILANRGILEYSDLLKRPLDTYKYLLTTTESGHINLQGILTELDIIFVGTSNEVHLTALKQHPDYNSFNARFNYIRVPYLLDYKEEALIYQRQVQDLMSKSIFEPHALSLLCMFAVMTRLRPPQGKNYKDKNLADIAVSLNPLEKCMLLAGDSPPDHLSMEGRQTLLQGLDDVWGEFDNDTLYEGKFGLSPRDVKNIIYKMTCLFKKITTMDIIDFLESLIQKKNDYDFLNIPSLGDYHNPGKFILLLKDHALHVFNNELLDSLGLVDDRSYEDHIKRYIENVNAFIKGEKVKDYVTGQFVESDRYFIEKFENTINLKEAPDKFRSHLISKLGAWYLDHSGEEISYSKVFPDVMKKLQESFFQEQIKVIQNISRNLVFFEIESSNSSLSEENRKQIQMVLDNLTKKYGHSIEGAISSIKSVVREKY